MIRRNNVHLRSLPAHAASSLLLLCGAAVLGCSELPEREPLPDWVGGQDDTDDPDDTDNPQVPTGTFTLTAPTVEEIGWQVKLHRNGNDWGAPCSVTVPENYRDQVSLDCTLEIQEMALFGGGLDFDLSVAPSQCSFLTWFHPMYQAWPIGEGPDTVSVTMRADGVIIEETNALNGKPLCDFDHSWTHEDGPNCCYGPYEYSVLNPAGEYIVKPEIRFWDGELSECFNGAAYLDSEATFTDDGWPTGKIIHVEQFGYNHRFHWENLSTQGYTSNVPLASYYDPANHDGGPPAGFRHPVSLGHHLFECWDEAEENLARIRLTVREWNTEEEFAKGPEGDPHKTGTEPDGGPLDDRADWSVATPGSTDFIMDAQ